jgi:hypothetical protein
MNAQKVNTLLLVSVGLGRSSLAKNASGSVKRDCSPPVRPLEANAERFWYLVWGFSKMALWTDPVGQQVHLHTACRYNVSCILTSEQALSHTADHAPCIWLSVLLEGMSTGASEL